MPRIAFIPSGASVEVEDKTKILLGARRASLPIRFACASCRCGTCAVRVVEGTTHISEMKSDEQRLLKRLELPLDGSIRLACQSRVLGDCKIDLSFQDEYDSDIGLEDDEEV